MENEKLSGSYTQKYDPMSDSFVVIENKERKFEPFSFFRRKNKIMESEVVPVPPVQSPQQPTPQPSPQPSNGVITPNRPIQRPQQPMPQPNTPVSLVRHAYNRFATLDSLYQNFAEKYPDNADLFNDLANETAILQATILSIYQNLSGNNFLPAQDHNKPELTGNQCADLITLQNYLQNTIDTIIQLQRVINVQNIDRQLAIIVSTLFSQKNKLSSLQTSC